MSTPKTAGWVARPKRKLRVAFVDDAFWGYVDLPDVPSAQKRFEDGLRASTGGKVSLYKPGSPYRDSVTPALAEANLHVFEDAPVDGGAADVKPASTAPVSRPAPTNAISVQPRGGTLSGYSHWWKALPTVPGSQEDRDWWATADGRSSRYERLRRVWFDTTRSFWFYKPDQEDHLTATLWENFTLFHPSIFVPKLFDAAGLAMPSGVTDACWSYEFEERVDGHLKQIDVTVHFRDAAGDALLIVEAKRPGGPLKASDENPAYYLDLPSFQFTTKRHMIYLVDAADLPAIRARVSSPTSSAPGFLSWQQLGELQVMLAGSLPAPDDVRQLIACLLRWQFERHGFRVSGPTYPSGTASLDELLDANQRLLPLLAGSTSSSTPLADRAAEQVRLARQLDVPVQVRTFLAGAIQHQSCTCGVTPPELVWDYLHQEPSQVEIVPGMEGRQRTAERRKALWQIPAARPTSDAVE